MLIDLDLRYPEEITERQHDQDDIIAVLELFYQSFQELFDFNEKIEFQVFISQKKDLFVIKVKKLKMVFIWSGVLI